jgi:hypothetical protein
MHEIERRHTNFLIMGIIKQGQNRGVLTKSLFVFEISFEISISLFQGALLQMHTSGDSADNRGHGMME